MIKIENVNTYGWEAAIRGMRNPMNSWKLSDSGFKLFATQEGGSWEVGKHDMDLMKILVAAGNDHSKFMRMIGITMDITAPLYWWKEFDTYKIGTVANSCSTMHKIAEKKFTMDDFSCEHLFDQNYDEDDLMIDSGYSPYDLMKLTVRSLNYYRQKYLTAKIKPMKEEAKRAENVKNYWWQMIQLLPSSYNQKRTVSLNYTVARNQYHARKDHKLDEWRIYCDFLKTLPYSELITMKKGGH
nr:MAG TPA: hypothetical protein [Caudoviricetes sp.]